MESLPSGAQRLGYKLLQATLIGDMDEHFLRGVLLLDTEYKVLQGTLPRGEGDRGGGQGRGGGGQRLGYKLLQATLIGDMDEHFLPGVLLLETDYRVL